MHIKKFLHYSFITVAEIFLFFQEVAQLSQNKNLRYAEMLRKRALIFALLSVFLEDEHFIPLLLNVLQPNMRTRVCTVINNNIAHEWTLARIASELLMSPSLLKKKIARRRDIIFTVAY